MALTFLIDAYDEETLEDETRVVLHLHPEIAPITVGVFPLVKKEGMPEKAHEIEDELRRARLRDLLRREGARSAGATAARTRSARRSASRSTATR